MPAFFFASGILFGKNIEKKHGLKEFSGKFDAIFYPYLIWSLLIGAFEVLSSGIRNGSSSFNELPAIFWHPRGVFWFLYSLILAFGLTEITIYFAGPKRGRLLTLPIALALLWIYPHITINDFSLPLFCLSYVYFSLGLIFSKSIPSRQYSPRNAIFWLTALILAQYIFHILLGERTLSFQSVSPNAAVFAMITGFLVFGFAYSLPSQGTAWLANLGEKSMDVYLMHLLFIASLRIIFQKVLGIENAMLYIIPGMLVGLCGPLAAAHVLRKIGLNFLFTPPKFLSLKSRLQKIPTST